MKKGVDYIGVAVVFLCHDGKGNYLVSKRSQNCRDEKGRWDCGSGGIEHGELLEETLRREIKEEYGADVISSEFLGFREVHRESENGKTHWFSFDFRVQVDPSTVRIAEPEMIDELRWVAIADIPEPMHSQLPFFLEKYKGKW